MVFQTVFARRLSSIMLPARRVLRPMNAYSSMTVRPVSSESSADLDALHKRLDIASNERAELQRQVSLLVQHSAQLTKHMELLTKGMQNPANSETLMQSRASRIRTADRDLCGSLKENKPADFRPLRHEVLDQPTHVSQVGNRDLFSLAMHGKHSAHKERLLREIMQVDGVTWEEAHDKLGEIDIANEKYYWLQTMVYRIGMTCAGTCALGGIALVFYPPVAEYYGVNVAGETLPEGVEHISQMTINQVGNWTWGWMEPMIGVASFVLLCAQFGRAQMWKLNMRPYTEYMLRSRANRLAKAYPNYERGIVRDWAKHIPVVNILSMPSYRRFLGFRRL